MRGAVYVDGFNVYHSVNDIGKPHLKWLDLRKLGELIARGHARTIERVVYCTAYFPGDHGKKVRHKAYVDALSLAGVDTLLGHTIREPMECKYHGCGFRWDEPREKATDINLALATYGDAHKDLYDVAFVITADTDQVATLQTVKSQFPGKRLISVCPPGRKPSKHLRDLADATFQLTEDHIDQCVFPAMVAKAGCRTILRPREYAPPEGWVHPEQRPGKKPNSN